MKTIISIGPCAVGIRQLGKMTWLKWPVYFILLSVLFMGCASFSDELINPHKIDLNPVNLTRLSGTYELVPDLYYTNKGIPEISKSPYSAGNVHRYISTKRIELEHSDNLTLTIKVLQSDSISFLFKKDYLMLDSVILSAELQPSGMLFLGNSTVEATGIPYLFGGTVVEKTRVGLAKDDGLILDHIFNSSGAFLLIFFGGHYSQTAYHFKRIK